MHSRSFNSGYHQNWLYFSSPDLESMKPWGKLSEIIIDDLNDLPEKTEAIIVKFHIEIIRYIAKNFVSLAFLNKHESKILFKHTIVLV